LRMRSGVRSNLRSNDFFDAHISPR